MNPALRSELLVIALLAAATVVAINIFGQPATALCVALAIYLGWQISNTWRLYRWLASGKDGDKGDVRPPPRLYGLSSTLADHIGSSLNAHASFKRQNKDKKRSNFLKRLREAVAALPDAAVILDREDRIEWSNPAAADLLWLSWTKSSGKPITEVIRGSRFKDYMAEREFAAPFETVAPTADGRYLSIQVTRFGKKRQRLLIARDITAVHNLDNVRRDFIANVSHELRTPLTVMNGFLETMQDDADGCPQWARSIDLMEAQSRRMQSLVNDLLALSRLEMETEAEHEPVPVPQLLESVVSDARKVSGDDQHDIQLNAQADLWLLGNPSQLQSIVTNLVFNAVQHTLPGTRIEISWQGDENGALFSVSDNGDGIARQHLARLTERFYRVDKARSRRNGGTGLGLAIVKHALARHNSHLEVSSREGRGTRFECSFDASRITTPDADVGTGSGSGSDPDTTH